jgi:glyoxylase-like metal-dependent hydrolase (beta-lactamase superfamily II)
MTSASKTSRGVKGVRASLRTPAKSSMQSGRRGSSAGPGGRPHETTGRGARARASVRVYCQGLGDCILVRVTRQSGGDFKLLIDCGVVLGTDDAIRKITDVVEDVVKDTREKPDDPRGKIDILAITHEHWDHLSGFNQAADSFENLSVDSVWVAWTEDPNDDLAKQLKSELGKAEEALAACATAFRATGDGATVDLLSNIP